MRRKTHLTLIGLAVWAIVYFPINHLTQFRTTHDVSFAFESSIPFLPFFVVFYLAAILMIVSPYFIARRTDFEKIVLSYITVIGVSGIVYLLFPVAVSRPEITSTGFFAWLLQLVYTVVLPHNALPSLHASLTTLTLLIIYYSNRSLALGMTPLWILILLSTLFTKMHYVVDLVAGVTLAVIVYVFFFVVNRENQPAPPPS